MICDECGSPCAMTHCQTCDDEGERRQRDHYLGLSKESTMKRGKLVLSRKVGESIEIGDNVTVTINEVRGDKVRVLVQAPEDITVHRTEIAEAIASENGVGAGCGGTTPARTS